MNIRTVLAAAVLLTGCCFNDRHWIGNPGKDEFIRVVSGDHIYFSLEEAADCRWTMTCDDPDVEVRLERTPAAEEAAGTPGRVDVEILIHRGYDGPSVVQFACRRPGRKKPVKKFRIGLFKRTGDVAFWE